MFDCAGLKGEGGLVVASFFRSLPPCRIRGLLLSGGESNGFGGGPRGINGGSPGGGGGGTTGNEMNGFGNASTGSGVTSRLN